MKEAVILILIYRIVNGGPHDYQFYFNKVQLVGEINFEDDHRKIYSNVPSPMKSKSKSTIMLSKKFSDLKLRKYSEYNSPYTNHSKPSSLDVVKVNNVII
jgi:hypothetical protein